MDAHLTSLKISNYCIVPNITPNDFIVCKGFTGPFLKHIKFILKIRPRNTFNKITSTNIRLLMPNEVNNWQ